MSKGRDYLIRREELARKRVKQLRENATIHERVFKRLLEDARIPHVFQKPFVTYSWFLIADFFIPSINTIIELDGGQHLREEGFERDKARQEWLERDGIKVIHLTNKESLKLTIDSVRELLGYPKKRIESKVDKKQTIFKF